MGFRTLSTGDTGAIQDTVDSILRGEVDGDDLRLDQLPSVLARLSETSTSFEFLLPALLALNGEPYSLREHYPFAPLYNRRLSQNTTWKTGRQVAKTCHPELSRVYNEYGRRIKLKDVRVGDRVISVDETTLKRVVRTVLDIHPSPDKPALRLHTRKGVKLVLAETHPLRKFQGWVRAENLAVGDRIAHITHGGEFGSREVPVKKFKFAVKSAGLFGIVPFGVFEFSEPQLREFLIALWTGYGTISPQGAMYHAMRRDLVFDLKSLLLKFGISSSIMEKGFPGEPFSLKVDNPALFFSEFPSLGSSSEQQSLSYPREARELAFSLASEVPHGSRDNSLVLPSDEPFNRSQLQEHVSFLQEHRGNHPRLRELETLLTGDVEWDEVVSIESMGLQPCLDIEVEHDHNYVLDGVLSHNSTNVASSSLVRSAVIPHLKTLFITPQDEQIRRFSTNYVGEFLKTSPVRELFLTSGVGGSVRQKDFKNGSKMIFSFAQHDATRVRGVSADQIFYDEIQDIDRCVLPIIDQCMSHSNWKITMLTGTPLTNDNLSQHVWEMSDQCEWFIRCTHCTEGGHPTWNIPSVDYHLYRMLGPYRDDISEKSPGLVCHKCEKPIHPKNGKWVPRYRDRSGVFDGYHVPQVILPLHYADKNNWGEILDRREGYKNTTPAQFHNEILGESYDRATKLVTETDLKRVSREIGPNNPESKDRIADRCIYWVMGIDWGGGGGQSATESHSFTTAAMVGLGVDGKIYVPWGIRLLTPHDQILEARTLKAYYDMFLPDLIAHDFSGSGEHRLAWMVQAGMPSEKIMNCEYVGAAKNNIVTHVPPTDFHPRHRHRVDKARTLGTLCRAIQLGGVQFFNWDYEGEGRRGLLYDFLSLVEEKRKTSLRDIYVIGCMTGGMDDFAQAVNFGAVACWHTHNQWPDYFKLAQQTMDQGFFSVKV